MIHHNRSHATFYASGIILHEFPLKSPTLLRMLEFKILKGYCNFVNFFQNFVHFNVPKTFWFIQKKEMQSLNSLKRSKISTVDLCVKFRTRAIISSACTFFIKNFNTVYNQERFILQTIYVIDMESWALNPRARFIMARVR